MFLGKYVGHIYRKCSGDGCSGCRHDGMDCMYEALSVCSVCHAYEGSLLPFCPGRPVSFDEQEVHYRHYCAATGPFARATLETLELAYQTAWQVALSRKPGDYGIYFALAELRGFLAEREIRRARGLAP